MTCLLVLLRLKVYMKKIIFNKVAKLRKQAGISQAKLAKKLGVTRQTIISMEKGSYSPSVFLAIKIARYFKKSVEEIFRIK